MKKSTWCMAVVAVVMLGTAVEARPPEGDDATGDRRGPSGIGQANDRGGPPSPDRMVEHAMEFDADGDGKLDRAELTKFAEEMHAMRMRGGPGGQGGQGGGPGGQRRGLGGQGVGPAGGQGFGPGGQGSGPGGQRPRGGPGQGGGRGGRGGPSGEGGDFERPRPPE